MNQQPWPPYDLTVKVKNIDNYVCCHMYVSGAMHRERRGFLRNALKELVKVLEDEPGLLGPKVHDLI